MPEVPQNDPRVRRLALAIGRARHDLNFHQCETQARLRLAARDRNLRDAQKAPRQ